MKIIHEQFHFDRFTEKKSNRQNKPANQLSTFTIGQCKNNDYDSLF